MMLFASYTFVRNLIRTWLGDSVQFCSGWGSAYRAQWSELGKLWPAGQIRPKDVFTNNVGTQPHPLLCVLSIAASLPQWWKWVLVTGMCSLKYLLSGSLQMASWSTGTEELHSQAGQLRLSFTGYDFFLKLWRHPLVSLIPDCTCHVSSCVPLQPPCLPHREVHLELQAKNKS